MQPTARSTSHSSSATGTAPAEPERRGAHLTLEHPAFRDVTPELWAQGVIPDFRAPQGLRLGLSPLSTSYAEVLTGIAAVRDLLAAA